ncbi:hypothetical protein IJ531_01890 [bacterium]|nr:hypothetical protein [bacterium]
MKTLKTIALILFFTMSLCFAQGDIDIQLSRIENSIWGFTYQKDDTPKRLSRIENNVFGKTSSNLTTEQRMKKLNETLGLDTFQDKITLAQELEEEEADINYPQIDTLEYQMFQETYQKESIYKRLERLEKKIFGSTQEGNLALRTDRLKAYIQKDVVAQNPSYYSKKPYTLTQDVEQYMGSQSRFENSDIHIQLAGLETALFSKTYSQDPIGVRLNRLERKIFQRDFSSDDEYLRLQRLQAAANAQQTAKLYEANKIQKYTSTGIQLGSIILMILALIL